MFKNTTHIIYIHLILIEGIPLCLKFNYKKLKSNTTVLCLTEYIYILFFIIVYTFSFIYVQIGDIT
jgi:hypothetical protein